MFNVLLSIHIEGGIAVFFIASSKWQKYPTVYKNDWPLNLLLFNMIVIFIMICIVNLGTKLMEFYFLLQNDSDIDDGFDDMEFQGQTVFPR
jgi:hypothetical protein